MVVLEFVVRKRRRSKRVRQSFGDAFSGVSEEGSRGGRALERNMTVAVELVEREDEDKKEQCNGDASSGVSEEGSR